MHPNLPEQWVSKALRVAMSEHDWDRFDAIVRELGVGAPTQARATGQALSALIHGVPAPEPQPGPLDWMDWERRKALRLLLPRR